jgi:hypothetical protein
MRAALLFFLLLAATLPGCTRTFRFEAGVRTTFEGDRILRVGASIGIGTCNDRRDFSLTESVGYRYAGASNATFTTRAMWGVGPVYVSGSFDIDDDAGIDVASALAIPLHREKLEEWGGGALHMISAGVQLRVGRHDGVNNAGADFVLGWDELDPDAGNFVPR